MMTGMHLCVYGSPQWAICSAMQLFHLYFARKSVLKNDRFVSDSGPSGVESHNCFERCMEKMNA